jgi:hypothetical protein
LKEDFVLLRDCNALIHSNSTFCWIASFLSKTKTHRFIPITATYASQNLGIIEESKDAVFRVESLEHEQVYRINIMCDHRDIETLSYSIPEEIIVTDSSSGISKTMTIAPLIPGGVSDYKFGPGQESKYYAMYQASRFGLTQKKGGWDCLRHYEILANGAIPIFDNLEKCPLDTLVTFPKQLLKEAKSDLLPWCNTEQQQRLYSVYRIQFLSHIRQHCTCKVVAQEVLSKIGASPESKILMLTGDSGVNYTRELTWIGMKRILGNNAVEWPPIDYLYDSFADNRSKLYGNGFTYSRRLPHNLRVELSEQDIIQSIQDKKWDYIIYGKIGPDEGQEGSLPNLPLWSNIFKRYNREQIVFWYGGDEMNDMTWGNKYSHHLVNHCQYARCFVRELIRWDGKF